MSSARGTIERRSRLRGVTAMLASFVLGAALVPGLAYAADGEPLLAGGSHSATRTTLLRLIGSGEGASALRVVGDGANFGLTAESLRGTAVQGTAFVPGASGVRGINTNDGFGVRGTSDGAAGVGVMASSTGGTALRVQGRISLSRSGRITVPAGSRSLTQTGVLLAPNSLVIATMQRRRSGVVVLAAVPDDVSDSFTVHLNKAPRKRTPIAWFVLN